MLTWQGWKFQHGQHLLYVLLTELILGQWTKLIPTAQIVMVEKGMILYD